jgi:hypothetical protein
MEASWKKSFWVIMDNQALGCIPGLGFAFDRPWLGFELGWLLVGWATGRSATATQGRTLQQGCLCHGLCEIEASWPMRWAATGIRGTGA